MTWTQNYHATCIENDVACKSAWPVCPVGKSDTIAKYITGGNGSFKVHAESGKVLGTHGSRAEAEAQLRAIEAHKHDTNKIGDIEKIGWTDEARAAAAAARAERAAATLDHTKNPYHKVLTQHGFEHQSTEEKQNQFARNNPDANYTEHVYAHPKRGKSKVIVTQYHAKTGPYKNDKLDNWRLHHEQENGIMAPTTGDTKPQLSRTLASHYGEPTTKAEETAPDDATVEVLKSAWTSYAQEIGLIFKSEEVMAEPIESNVFRIEAAGRRAYFRVESGQATRIEYHQKSALVPVQKAEKMRYTLGVVYAPGERDFHGDTMTEVEIEKSAWAFTKKEGLTGRVGLMHQSGTDKAGEVVESYVYRGPKWTFKDMKGVEQTIVPGTWMLGVVWTPESWVKVERGQINGFSLQGVARKFANGEEV